ncbi:hypothetical protein L2E82_15078 [Cichorium intybus]|uniref:Uncharacterized protein n=1 Tax=Cichorium intybus TaxID=13427 RepID=A0ACB9F194_CICIN|nr:hypothetical protein L2E82_15078 [Cichorium intybus]
MSTFISSNRGRAKKKEKSHLQLRLADFEKRGWGDCGGGCRGNDPNDDLQNERRDRRGGMGRRIGESKEVEYRCLKHYKKQSAEGQLS